MDSADGLPLIIQGGMGVGVSNWRLARAVSLLGHLGVVSGTALDTILVRRLQDGDPGGHVRRAMEHFPMPGVAADALRRWFRPEGRSAGTPYRMLPVYKQKVSRARQQVSMLGAFVEVWLAKEGHRFPVGLNLLTKVQLPNLAMLYGAMLADVEYILMGAGIPREIPAALDRLALHQPATLRFEVEGLGSGETEQLSLDPVEYWATLPPPLERPKFLAIIASNSLATMLARKSSGRVDGFVIEGPTAGGHNAPPRGELQLNAGGEPVYGERDEVDLARIAELGLPFWLAGGAGRPERLREARAAGAAGIQVGTLFAWCDESGFSEELKRSVLASAVKGEVRVFTDPKASPTGYPFKVVHWPDDPALPVARERLCDLGGLRVAYRTAEGKIGYRCAGEPVEAYVGKGGRVEDTEGRRCLCNALTAAIGLGQVRPDGTAEPPLVTSGDDLQIFAPFLRGRTRYTARDVIDWLLAPVA
jgi:NAD(P)H-dependent flavin oxidoreductase YrpB (nitropropane dioxygenase family)